MEHQAMIGCEIRVAIHSNEYEEVQELVKKIREACSKGDYELTINFKGDFIKNETKSIATQE